MSKKQVMLTLRGASLSMPGLMTLLRARRVQMSNSCQSRVNRSRRLVERLASGEKPLYGVNTGFGFFANTKIKQSDLKLMQTNIVRSHAGGSGEALSDDEVRLALLLRLNAFLRGNSGVRWELCQTILKFLNAGIHPLVPENGSVGASGDLIPLAHIGLGLMGEGRVRLKGKITSAKVALKKARIRPYQYHEKEGLSFINGTEVMQAVGGLALWKLMQLERAAYRIAALSFEALNARVSVLDKRIHELKNQPGQKKIASLMREELRGSYLYDRRLAFVRVQDPYSIRCMPQVHGASHDALQYAKGVVEAEYGAVTDNPLVFPEAQEILSGGNFHGEALAMAFDMAAIAAAELANIAERRIELLLNPYFSLLPAFLTEHGGFESGYMVLQYLSASLVSENKILSHPASVDSIPGNVGIEDFVSMGMTAAHKLKRIVSNLETVLACELLAAGQGVHLKRVTNLGKGTQESYALFRKRIKPLKHDRVVSSDVEISKHVVRAL